MDRPVEPATSGPVPTSPETTGVLESYGRGSGSGRGPRVPPAPPPGPETSHGPHCPTDPVSFSCPGQTGRRRPHDSPEPALSYFSPLPPRGHVLMVRAPWSLPEGPPAPALQVWSRCVPFRRLRCRHRPRFRDPVLGQVNSSGDPVSLRRSPYDPRLRCRGGSETGGFGATRVPPRAGYDPAVPLWGFGAGSVRGGRGRCGCAWFETRSRGRVGQELIRLTVFL